MLQPNPVLSFLLKVLIQSGGAVRGYPQQLVQVKLGLQDLVGKLRERTSHSWDFLESSP